MTDNFIMIARQMCILLILIGIGFVCGKRKILTESSSKKITDIVLYIVTPCVMITAFQREFSAQLLGNVLITALCAALIMAATVLVCMLIFRGKDDSSRKVMRFSVVFSNCGFMSLPLQKAILGDDGWFYGSIFVAVFNIIVWTYGLVSMSGEIKQLSPKKIIFNPGIVGAAAAMILFVCKITLPEVIIQPINYLAEMNTPLPMLIIGFYLSQANFRRAFGSGAVYLCIALRLIAVPVISALLMSLFGVDSTIAVTCVIACCAPTAATTTMFASKFNRDTGLSVSIVAASTVLSVLTMPFVIAFAQSIC